ncbi:hypothetical protein ACLKA6_005843 [Drosophila palustris]
MIFWSFTTIVKPILTYASLAWWTKVKQRKAAAELSKLQRLVCVGMTGAMSTCPTDALGIITGISPLPILIEKEACLGALRLQGVANLKSGDLIGHLKVLETFFTSPIVHLSDVQLPSLVFKRNFTVSIYDRSSWNNPNLCIPSGAQVWYTDGSKLENGDTGAGVYGPRFRRFCALEQETSEHVLCECPALCRRRLQILGVEALHKFRVYLLGLHFKLVSDCNAFTKTIDKKDVCVRVARWILLLQDYDFDVEHRAGTRIRHADALSRYPVMMISNDSMHSKIKYLQAQDDELKAIIDILAEKDTHNNYFMKSDLLHKLVDDDELIVVPLALQREIIKQAHEKGHFSVKKTKDMIDIKIEMSLTSQFSIG